MYCNWLTYILDISFHFVNVVSESHWHHHHHYMKLGRSRSNYSGNPRKSAHSKIRPWTGSRKKIPKNAPMGPFFCTSEMTGTRSVPNNPPRGQLLGETMYTITCVIKTLSGTRRSNEGKKYNFIIYCCVKWKCRIYDKIVSIICLNGVSVKHIYSTKRENIDQQGYALYKDLW